MSHENSLESSSHEYERTNYFESILNEARKRGIMFDEKEITLWESLNEQLSDGDEFTFATVRNELNGTFSAMSKSENVYFRMVLALLSERVAQGIVDIKICEELPITDTDSLYGRMGVQPVLANEGNLICNLLISGNAIYNSELTSTAFTLVHELDHIEMFLQTYAATDFHIPNTLRFQQTKDQLFTSNEARIAFEARAYKFQAESIIRHVGLTGDHRLDFDDLKLTADYITHMNSGNDSWTGYIEKNKMPYLHLD